MTSSTPNVLITGTNRGLGLEMVRQYAGQGWTVHACCRNPDKADELKDIATAHPSKVILHALEVTDFDQIDQLAEELKDTPIDLLINNAGVFGPKVREHNDYSQMFGHMDYDVWTEILRINTFAPLKMVEAFVDHVTASDLKKIVVISSLIGSSGEAQGEFYAYGTSKAAVSKVFANLAIDLAPRGIAVGVYCPGWVPTELGGSQGTVPIEESIKGLRARFDELNLDNAGSFTRYNGETISW